MLHAAQTDRTERDRCRRRGADDLGGNVALIDIHQHALTQLDGGEIVEVGVECLLVIRAAVGIFEKGAWNPPAGKLTQVFDAGRDFHGGSAALNWCRRFEVPTRPAVSSFRNFKSISGTRINTLASAPLLPKFVSEGAAMY